MQNSAAFAFLGHQSALDVIRHLGKDFRDAPRWPQKSRRLPSSDSCVHKQLAFRAFIAEESLKEHGVVNSPVHLLVPDARSRRKGIQARFHVWQNLIPGFSMLRLSPYLLSSGPELVLAQLAGYQLKSGPLIEEKARRFKQEKRELAYLGIDEKPQFDHPLRWEHFMRRVRLAAIAMELAGTYRLAPDGTQPDYKAGPVMSKASVMHMLMELPDLFGANRLRCALSMAAESSASPMETSLFLMLTLPTEWGGFGLPHPLLNHSLDFSRVRGVLAVGDSISPDFLWQDHRLALEYESDEFHRKWHRLKLQSDVQRANALSGAGYTVLRATPEETLNLQALTMLSRQIALLLEAPFMEADAMGLHRRKLLHAELFPNSWRDV